MKRRIMVDNI
ncbi:hypothetical protein NQ317_000564 [Molorchus minor]|uniref:Uncharacterized protein n=1 Tax=Molorchus minor TaxID=1323400 RepID=A0ABQ9ISE6_9CUCU|nr:hypothetical protein NQ317_000564 [Molorchus minor]